MEWTAEQVFTLTPDENSRRISRRMAGADKWLMLGSGHGLVWGEFAVRNKPPIQTAVRLSDPAAVCTCGNRRSPCDHAISLLLMWAEERDCFPISESPNWVLTTLSALPHFDHNANLPAIHGEKANKRYTAIMRGLEGLELWLLDLAQHGLADAQQRPKVAWAQVAERLVDAGASEIAREVKRIAEIPTSGADWPEHMLGRIGMLYLLIQGFKRLDTLPADTQADLRAAVGWLPRVDPSRADLLVRDRWHVLANHLAQEGRHRLQRTWLWGEAHNRPALIVQRSHKMTHFDARLMTGTALDAELCYFPATTPIRAQIMTLYERNQPTIPVIGYASIDQAIGAYSRVISLNAWIGVFPIVLHSAVAASDENGLVLRDSEHRALPLPAKFGHLWHLDALTRHGDAPIFGEWDGEILHPLSVWAGGRWIELRTLRGHS